MSIGYRAVYFFVRVVHPAAAQHWLIAFSWYSRECRVMLSAVCRSKFRFPRPSAVQFGFLSWKQMRFLSHQDFVCCIFIHFSIFPVYFKLFSFLFSNAARCCWHLFFTILQLINISHQQSFSSQLHDWNIHIFSVWQKDNQAGSGASTDRC